MTQQTIDACDLIHQQNVKRKVMNTQIVGNAGLYYVCYELSKKGWNVMPTSRNAKGVDIIAYKDNLTATRYISVQVKALSKRSPVPLGNSIEKIMGDFWTIVILDKTPNIYILKPDNVKNLAHKGEKDGRVSLWLQPNAYENSKDRWDIIENYDVHGN